MNYFLIPESWGVGRPHTPTAPPERKSPRQVKIRPLTCASRPTGHGYFRRSLEYMFAIYSNHNTRRCL